MDYEPIETKQKLFHNKIFVILILLLVLAMFMGNIVLIANSYNKKNVQEDTGEVTTISRIATKKVNKHTYEFKKEPVTQITDEIREKFNNIYNTEEKVAYLTFDDGPSRQVTIPILDILKQEKVPATFFTLGSRIEFYPELVKREYEEGHYVANHGYSHQYSAIYTNVNTVLDEYYRTEQLIKNAIGNQEYSSHLFRFPGGSKGGKYKDVKNEAINVLEERGIMHIDWNSLTGDSEGKKTRDEMMEYLLKTMGDKNCVVILMHDAGDKTYTAELLPEIIAYLKEQGFIFKNFYDIIS